MGESRKPGETGFTGSMSLCHPAKQDMVLVTELRRQRFNCCFSRKIDCCNYIGLLKKIFLCLLLFALSIKFHQVPISVLLPYSLRDFQLHLVAMSSDANDKTWEEILSVTILNRTWRLDAAARAFPHGHEDEDLMKARWTIGLYLELVSHYLFLQAIHGSYTPCI